MTKTFFRAALIAVFCAVITSISWSQGFSNEGDWDKKKKNKKDEVEWKQKIWYGAGLNLFFSGYNGQSAFGLGISPMAGYKVLPFLSAGPRVSLAYTAQKVYGYKAFNLFDIETGAFVRVKPFLGFFIQAEIAKDWSQQLYGNASGDVFKKTENYINPYTGIGYNFSRGEGGFSSEVSLMYNFRIANDIATSQSPVIYRFAFTYNF